LVEAITLAGIPTELDKQIRLLKLAAEEQNVKQDEQLQIIETLRTQLEERIEGVRSVLDTIQGPDPVAKDRHQEQLDASRTVHTRVDELSEVLESRAEQLESAMKEQKQLMLALKSFLEDKTSRPEHALQSGNERVNESENRNPWPSSTLSTAYFAASLLSSVLSSVAATSIVSRNRDLNKTSGPVFLPVDYSLPGLGTLNKIQIQPSLLKRVEMPGITESNTETESNIETVVSAQDGQARFMITAITSTPAKPKDSTPVKSSDEWIQDYSRTQRAVRQPGEQRSRPERLGLVLGSSMGPGWIGSVLEIPEDDGNGSDGGAPGDGEPDVDGFHDGLDLAIPSTSHDDGDFSWERSSGGGEGGGGGQGSSSSSDSDSDSS
jgi:hypothetical protein